MNEFGMKHKAVIESVTNEVGEYKRLIHCIVNDSPSVVMIDVVDRNNYKTKFRVTLHTDITSAPSPAIAEAFVEVVVGMCVIPICIEAIRLKIQEQAENLYSIMNSLSILEEAEFVLGACEEKPYFGT